MKLSIVTPSFNSSRFISETIETVLSQKGHFELEYIIVDGGSTDGTVEIIKEYADKYSNIKWISEPDEGMYDAINKGFSLATGDIFAWINTDDKYEFGAFDKIAYVFSKFSEIRWLKGITSYIDENSKVTSVGKCFLYKKEWIEKGFYGKDMFFIQQDSVFWRKELWGKVASIDKNLKFAGDYWLWLQFAKYAELYSFNQVVSYFRKSDGQLSSERDKYYLEMDKIRVHHKLKKDLWLFKQLNRRRKKGKLFNLLLKYLFWYKSHCVFCNENGVIEIKKMYELMVSK